MRVRAQKDKKAKKKSKTEGSKKEKKHHKHSSSSKEEDAKHEDHEEDSASAAHSSGENAVFDPSKKPVKGILKKEGEATKKPGLKTHLTEASAEGHEAETHDSQFKLRVVEGKKGLVRPGSGNKPLKSLSSSGSTSGSSGDSLARDSDDSLPARNTISRG